MKLYILRHGDAVPHGDPRYAEDQRPLTEKGVQRTRQLAHSLERMEVGFDAILTSPLVRALQTAEIVARRLGCERKVKRVTSLEPFGDMDALVHDVNGIRPVPERVLLVGHEPYLSGLVSLLCTGGAGLPLEFKKGGLCRLDVDVLSCGKCATLEWLVPPRIFGVSPSKR